MRQPNISIGTMVPSVSGFGEFLLFALDAISAYPDTDAQYAYDYLAMGMESTTSSSTMAHAPGNDASLGGMVTIGPQGPQSREQADR